MAIPVHQKYLLTISEASEYFSIGEKKLPWLDSLHARFHSAAYLLLSRINVTKKNSGFSTRLPDEKTMEVRV